MPHLLDQKYSSWFSTSGDSVATSVPVSVSVPGNWSWKLDFYAWLFVCLFFLRYFRTLVNALAFWTIKEMDLPLKPTFTGDNVTVILPTTLTSDVLGCLSSILRNCPFEVLLVVPSTKLTEAMEMIRNEGLQGVRVLEVARNGKRAQMVKGLREVKTEIIVFADDDVYWTPTYLQYLLAAFEDPGVGAAGTNQRVRRKEGWIWNLLGAAYLERRNFNTFATNTLDGGLSTLSGRTSAYRSEILQTPVFYRSFTQDLFLGARIKIGDDKALTKWTFSHGWRIKLVYTEEAVLYTDVEQGTLYLSQCMRWARSHWQGNAAVLLSPACSYVCKKHPWTFYASYLGSLFVPSLLWDAGLFVTLLWGFPGTPQGYLALGYWLWTLGIKMVKMGGHFKRHPSDLLLFPVLVGFSYLHGFLNVWAFVTMRSSCWGGRPSLGKEQPLTGRA